MDVQKKLSQLAEIDGFLGTALFSAEGRLLAKCEPFDIDLKLIATLANNMLVNAQKTALDMGFGNCALTCVHTDKALILLRCLNEGRNPLRAEPGKSHIHLVLLVDNPDSFGIARLEINRVIESLAEDFRLQETAEKKKKTAAPAPSQKKNNMQTAAQRQEQLKHVADFLDDKQIDEMFDGLLIQPEQRLGE
ncbi:Putative regulator of Ras-like GTPase activity, Roadblock/LC7/MglB family [Candidatus Electronema halotolerans]